MHEAVVADPVDRHPRGGELVGVRLALVAQRVELGGDDDRARLAGQALGAQRRDPRVLALGLVGDVVGEEPLHRRELEEVALGVLDAARSFGQRVGRRVEQQLHVDDVRARLRRDRGEVAAGAVAGDGDAPSAAELLTVLADPADRGDHVVGGRGEGVLGREAVVVGQHRRVGVAAQPAAGLVVGVEVADDEAAAVEVHAWSATVRRPRGGRAGRPAVRPRRGPGAPGPRRPSRPSSGETRSTVIARKALRASSGFPSCIGG